MLFRPPTRETGLGQFSWIVFAALIAALLLLARSTAPPLTTSKVPSAALGQTVNVPSERVPLSTNSHAVTYQDGKQFESIISAEKAH